MGEGESPTARNNTDDGTAIVLHWLCIVHRSQNQGDKKGILAETFRSTKQYWHGKIAVNTLFSNTRSYAALRAADLDWIVGPGYSLGG